MPENSHRQKYNGFSFAFRLTRSTPDHRKETEKDEFSSENELQGEKKKTFGLTMTRMDYFPSQKRLVYRKMKLLVPTRSSAPKIRQGFQYKNGHLSTLESSIPASDTSTTSSTTSTSQARRRMVPELLRCQKNFEHDRQHVNNVTRVAISESEDFER